MSTTDRIVEWATGLMETLGAPGTAVFIAAENLFPPIPSELLLPLAGFTASKGDLALYSVLIWATVGSVVGALALYAVGAIFGRNRVRAIAVRLPLVELADIDKAEAWFQRHGGKAVFFGRMVPIVRSLISVPAGIERMPLPRFLLYTTFGSGIWNSIFVIAGFQLGERFELVEQYADVLKYVVIVAAVIAIGIFLVSRIRRIRNRRQSDTTQPSQEQPGTDTHRARTSQD